MESSLSKKLVTVSFVATAFIAALVARVLLESSAAAFGVVAKYYGMDIVKHGIPVGTGLLLFAYLQFTPKVRNWADEVVLEISKVVWPSHRDTRAMTITCCIMLLVSGVMLWTMDALSTAVVKMLLN